MPLTASADPNASNCDAECGDVTAANVARYVACRQQCILPDFTGSSVALSCGANTTFFSSIYACVPNSIVSLATFLPSFLAGKQCAGQTVSTTTQLEGLRFCTAITGALTVTVDDASADYSSLYNIATISGAHWQHALLLVVTCVAGPLAVVNSSIDSLLHFAHLSSIGGAGGSYVLNGVGYAAAVTGACVGCGCQPDTSVQATVCWLTAATS